MYKPIFNIQAYKTLQSCSRKKMDVTNKSSKETNVNSTSGISKKNIFKNIVVLNTVFLLTGISYNGLEAIQSSLHAEEGVGTISTSVSYGFYSLSCLFIAPFLIRVCGFKWTVVMSLVPTLLWIVANGFGIWATMIPSAFLCGIFDATSWITHGSYTMEMAKEYAKQTNQLVDKVAAFFFGIYITFLMTGYAFGDIISNTVLSKGHSANYSEPDDTLIAQYCGINNCPWLDLNMAAFEDLPKSVVWSMLGVYTFFIIIAFIIGCTFLDPLPQYLQPEKQPVRKEICELLVSVIKLVKTQRIWFLTMMNIYSSSYVAFLYADFTRSWITCALGISNVGLIFMVYNILSAIMSIITGILVSYTGRFPLMIFSLVIGLATMICIVLWPINKSDKWVYFTMISGISLHTSILETVMVALYGIAYPTNSQGSYGCYNFGWCFISTIMYGYNYHICTDIKLYLQLAGIVIGYLGYILLECDLRSGSETTEVTEDKNNQLDKIDTKDEKIPILSDLNKHM